MKMNKRVALLLLLASICLLLYGCVGFGASEKYEYVEVEGGYALFRYSGVSIVDSLEIPDTHEGKPVVEIMEYAISSADYIKTLTIGKNVQKIADWGITNCLALEKIIVSAENPFFTVGDDGILYDKEKTKLLLYPNAREKNNVTVTVPDTVRKINDTAFYLSTSLTHIVFNDSLTEIGSYAFLKCSSLEDFVLPESLQKIGKDAFSYCDKLTTVVIPYNVTEIGAYAFFSMSSNLATIKVNRTASQMGEVTLGENWAPYAKNSLSKPIPIIYAEG